MSIKVKKLQNVVKSVRKCQIVKKKVSFKVEKLKYIVESVRMCQVVIQSDRMGEQSGDFLRKC